MSTDDSRLMSSSVKPVIVMLPSMTTSVNELFRVDCIGMASNLDVEDERLIACSFFLCLSKMARVLQENLQPVHEKFDPALYLTSDLLTILDPRVSRTNSL